MININVFSEEKAWSKKIKNKKFFFKKFVKIFQKNTNLLIKKYPFHYYFQITNALKN